MLPNRLFFWLSLLAASVSVQGLPEPGSPEADTLHFHLHARASNKNGSTPTYKDPNASIEDRVNDLLPRMTLDEKVAQMYACLHTTTFIFEL